MMHRLNGVLAVTTVLGVISVHNLRPRLSSGPERLVAEAPILGENQAFDGNAFLPVTIHGHAATLWIDLTNEGDLTLSTAALANVQVTLAANAAQLDSLNIGSDVQHKVPLQVIDAPTWTGQVAADLPPVVGIVGVHFLTTHYDLLYDFPNRRVRLYALPPHQVPPTQAWLPSGFTPATCGHMIHIPPGASTFTGFEMQLDGHPVTGVMEMGPYVPKMNHAAFALLNLSAQSPRVQAQEMPPQDTWGNRVPLEANVSDVEVKIGKKALGKGEFEVYPKLDVQALLPPTTPILLMNLSMLRNVALFNSTSSRQVCFAKL